MVELVIVLGYLTGRLLYLSRNGCLISFRMPSARPSIRSSPGGRLSAFGSAPVGESLSIQILDER